MYDFKNIGFEVSAWTESDGINCVLMLIYNYD